MKLSKVNDFLSNIEEVPANEIILDGIYEFENEYAFIKKNNTETKIYNNSYYFISSP